MAKQLNVNLGFTADTSQAKAKIQELQNSLTALINTPTGNFGNKMTKDIQQGIKAAAELKTHLKNATNVETGSLDFSKLNQSIKQSGSSLNVYGQKLQALGVDGQKAFMQFAQSVATSEIPIRRSNAMLTEMWTTLKNTARWQISSSILHGFMGALQSAYCYAQDLNESLNNIRIVTGKNIDEMATFAAQANKAAKALSATTTEYTDASLIYYQQGLDGAAVEERAAVTLKMANVSRQSAEVVSDQMTAVWNNFYDGSKSLEYYADVMTALGAATASSTDEISQGLEKFAAVADTVGLSYEYATAALATVTSETRQSADVVGTAFKTLFARIEGLSLGETLDDGTNLTKYSEALLKVGINVKDQNGQLKDMDSILNEMGSKWRTLAKDQQVALAQTVGGVRQYNQLISLMDNWDKFQQNLGTAQGSTGALQEQVDIYAESWEAAQDRVRAAAEAIYSDLLNDEAFIDILNIVEDFLTLIDNIIDSVGGLQGVLTNVGAILLKVFSSQMSQSITNMAYGFQMMTKAGRQKIQDEKTDFINNAVNSIQVDNTATPNANTRRQEMLKAELEVQKEMIEASSRMSELEQQTNQILLDRQRVLSENAIKTAETEDAAKERVSNAHMAGRIELAENQLTGGRYVNPDFVREDNAQYTQLTNTLSKTIALDIDLTELLQLREQAGLTEQDFSELATKISKLGNVQLDGIIADIKSVGVESEHGKEYVDQLLATIRMVINNTQSDLDSQLGISPEAIEELSVAYREEIRSVKESKKANEEAKKAREESSKSIKNAKGAQKQWSDTLVQSAQSTLSLVSALQSIINLGNIWSNENLTGGEKLLQTIMALGTAIPMAVSGLKGLSSAISFSALMQQVLTIQTQRQTMALNEQSAAEIRTAAVKLASSKTDKEVLSLNALKIAAEKLGIEVTEQSTHKILKKAIAQKLGITLTDETTTASLLEAAAHSLTAKATGKETTSKIAATGATIAETLAQHGLNAALAPFIGLMLAAVVAIVPYIAAAGLLAGAIALIALAVTEESRALKKAEEQEKQAAESAKRVADEINTINDALNKIQSTTETFKDLEKGTLEWYQALNEVNAEIQMLIDKYPKLLEMGAIIIDNGLLGISEKGIKYITQENAKQTTVANNITLRAQQNTAQTKLDQGWNGFSFQSNLPKQGNESDINATTSFAEEYEIMTTARNNFVKMAVKAYAVYGEAMFKSTEVADNIREAAIEANNGLDYFGEGSYSSAEQSEQILEILKNNKDLIIQQHSLQKKINTIDNQILMSRMSLAGSLRDAQQSQELMGDVTGAYKQKDGNKKELVYNDPITGDEVAWNMNQNENYGKNGEALPKEIQDFMALQGEDVEYVAQRWGNLVLEINGEKEKFSADQVYDGLKELYDEANFEEELREKLQEDLNNAFTNITLDDSISTDNLIAIDNFRLSLEESMTNLFPDASEEELEEKVNNMLETIVSAYGTSEESLAAFVQDTSFVDTASRQFQNLTETFQQGKISVDQYKQAIKELNAEGELNSMSAWFVEQADALGLKEEDAGKMQEYAKNLMELSEESGELSDSLVSDAQSAADLAVEITRMNKGIDSLADGFEDWSDVIKKSSKASAEYSDAMFEMKSALADVLDVESDLISSDFVEDHLDDIEKAATGDADAIDKLRASMDEEIIANIALGQTEEFKKELNNLDSELQSLVPEDIEVGMVLTGTNQVEQDFLEAANNLVEQAGMTADEANAYFAGIGYEPVYSQEEIDTGASVPNAKTTMQIEAVDQSGNAKVDLGLLGEVTLPNITYSTVSEPLEPTEADASMRLTSFSGGTTPPKIRGMRKKATGSQNNYSSSNKGGKAPGSSSKTSSNNSGSNKKQNIKKSEVVERYKEINDQLEDVSRNLNKINDKMDDAYGQARLDAMDEYLSKLKEENKLLEKKSKEIDKNLKEDQQTVADAAAGVGMSVKFDKNGNIANATQIENAWYNRLAGATTKEEQDEIQRQIDVWEDAQGDYEDSLSEYWDNEEEKRANKRKQQEKEFEKWNYKIELDVELDEGELALIDYYQNKLSDDIYGMAESVALTGQEVDITLGNLADREKQYAELTSLYESGKISQAQYAEGLKELQEAELEDLETLQQLQEEMEEYYANTLAMASEELDKYTTRLERSTAMLEHYQDLLDLTGQGQNYDAMRKVLDAQQETINNEYESSKIAYEMWRKQADDSYQKMLNATTDDDRERYKKEWEEAEQYANDAQDRTVNNAKKRAEIAAAIYENTLNRLNKQMEIALTNGRSFDEVSMQMKHQQSLQEEYLTTTNKIYETTKMMRNLQNEIDKTTNSVAKQKLKAFQQETKQLQEQGKLSKFELDIQQKKYDLLLAEIALEEAQNAKSTVRLTRDSEGNFGYVYTADQEQISGAQQAVDDAENALYNTQLDGANNYAEKSFQLRQEGLNALAELEEAHRNHQIGSEEEYQRRRQEIVDYYTQQLTDISNLYSIAVTDDSRVAADAWSTNITDLVVDADTWKTETTKYTSEVDQAFSTLNTELAKIAEEMGLNIEDLTKTISNVTKESDKWAKKMQDDVIPDMEDTINEVKTLANTLLKKLTPQIKDATKKGEALAEKMFKVQKKLSGLAGEAEKSASRAANVAGQWRSYWDAVNNSGGGGDTVDDYAPEPDDGGGTVLSVYGFSYKTENGTKLIKFEDGTYGYDSSFIEKNTNNFTAVPTKGANTYSGTQVGFDSSSGETIIKLGKKRASYDTGGYTGEWGSEGKLATLHEKELVLNKEDTKNFLASLELLHNIIKMIDINTSNSLINRLDSADLKTNKLKNDVLEQYVTIEAVFPNVEDKYEIEEAFMNMPNEASQYINRKNN